MDPSFSWSMIIISRVLLNILWRVWTVAGRECGMILSWLGQSLSLTSPWVTNLLVLWNVYTNPHVSGGGAQGYMTTGHSIIWQNSSVLCMECLSSLVICSYSFVLTKTTDYGCYILCECPCICTHGFSWKVCPWTESVLHHAVQWGVWASWLWGWYQLLPSFVLLNIKFRFMQSPAVGY